MTRRLWVLTLAMMCSTAGCSVDLPLPAAGVNVPDRLAAGEVERVVHECDLDGNEIRVTTNIDFGGGLVGGIDGDLARHLQDFADQARDHQRELRTSDPTNEALRVKPKDISAWVIYVGFQGDREQLRVAQACVENHWPQDSVSS